MRKKIMGVIFLMLWGTAANAALFDRGNGMIYDSVLNITWLQDANMSGLLNRAEAVAYVDNLVFGGYEDWRLPIMDVNGDGTVVSCPNVSEETCRDNELAYMFYENFGGAFDQDLTGDQAPFTGIQNFYWSNTPDLWAFGFFNGRQFIGNAAAGNISVWAVRDGDVAVIPLPAAAWLMLGGITSLLGFRRR